MSAAREFDLHYRLRPIVREIALARLARRGLSLDLGSAAVRELVGDLWKLVRPDREPPKDRQAPGPAGPASPNGREPGASLTVPMSIEELNAAGGPDSRGGRACGRRQTEALELVLLGILADGHVLIEDFPASRRR